MKFLDPLIDLTQMLHRGCVDLLKELIHLKITLLLWQTFPNSSTGGVDFK